MKTLTNKLMFFGEYGGSNVKVQSKGRSGYWEEIKEELNKDLKKDKHNLSAMNHSQSLFKIKGKVDIKLFQGEIDDMKLNHHFQQLEVYFNDHHIEEEQNISFSRLKLEGHALT